MVAGDDIEETGEVADGGKPVAVHPDLQEYLVHDLFGDVFVTDHFQDKSIDRNAIMIENDAKCTSFPFRNLPEQRFLLCKPVIGTTCTNISITGCPAK